MDGTEAQAKVSFKRIDPLVEGDLWDALVRRHPGAGIFHSSAWMRVLWETYRYQPFYYATEGNAPGTAPFLATLAEVDSWLTGRRGISLPFTDACPFLVSNGAGFRDLWDHALKVGSERAWRTIEVRDVAEGIGFPPSLQFHQHTLPLQADSAAVFDSFEGSVRRAIRKGEKSGLQVAIERSEEASGAYYRLHCLTRKKHGLPPQPFDFFRQIHRHIISPGLGFIALARLGGRPVAGVVVFEFNKKGLYKFGASDPTADSMRASNLAMWAAINELCRSGTKLLDFGRTSLGNDGLRRYKMSWGSDERVASYIKWSAGKARFLQEVDKSDGARNALFRKCPKFLSRALGEFLYPHIA